MYVGKGSQQREQALTTGVRVLFVEDHKVLAVVGARVKNVLADLNEKEEERGEDDEKIGTSDGSA